MRIIIHSDEYYPTAQACAYRMQVFTDTFMEMGDDVTVITSSANKMNGTIDSAAHKEKIIYAPAVRMTKKSTPMRLLNNLSFAVTSVLYSFGSGKADIVISTSPPPLISLSGWLIAKSKKARLIYDVRDIWPDVALEMGSFTENSFMCSVFRAIARFMYKHADIVTTVSPGKVNKIRGYVRDIGKEKGKNSGEDKVWLAGNGFDESVSRSEYFQSVVDEYGLEDKFTCVYIGNIGLAQGLDSLLRVAAETRHKDIQFLLFGKGAEKEMLEKKAQEEGLTNVRFCGPIEPKPTGKGVAVPGIMEDALWQMESVYLLWAENGDGTFSLSGIETYNAGSVVMDIVMLILGFVFLINRCRNVCDTSNLSDVFISVFFLVIFLILLYDFTEFV